jgi:hypothetical protein
MSENSNCREEILLAVRSIIDTKGRNEFSVVEVIKFLKDKKTAYSESTIRTHITSRCCSNSPINHAVVYKDFERIERGKYKALNC